MVLHSVLPSHTTLCIGFFHDPCSLSLDLQNINTKYMRVFVFSVFSEYYQNFLCSGFVSLKMKNLKINLLSLSYCENRNWSERNLYAVTSLRFLKNQIIQDGLPKLHVSPKEFQVDFLVSSRLSLDSLASGQLTPFLAVYKMRN